jgi:multicomponent K+:H+ antiporter subunit A
MLFDLGVFILVIGATTLILTVIAHQSLRKPRRAEPSSDTHVRLKEGIE